jgi:hypothetical protein
MHQIGTIHVLRNGEINPEGRQCGVGSRQLRGHEVRVHVWLVAGHPKTPDDHVNIGLQSTNELGHMDPGTPVNLRWILSGDQIDSHASTVLHGALVAGNLLP